MRGDLGRGAWWVWEHEGRRLGEKVWDLLKSGARAGRRALRRAEGKGGFWNNAVFRVLNASD